MLRVECIDGDERDLRPERFELSGRTLGVRELLDRWFGATYTYYKVLAEDENTYILKHHRLQDSWELVFTETDSPSEPIPSWPYTRSASSTPN